MMAMKKKNQKPKNFKSGRAKNAKRGDVFDEDAEGPYEEEFYGGYPKWFEEDVLQVKGKDNENDEMMMNNLRREAGALFQKEAAAAGGRALKTISKSDYSWIKTVVSKGTVSDKIAAYVLLLQDDPIVNFKHLENMVSMVKVSKKKECFMVVDTLVELFIDHLLPPDRKLSLFTQQPMSASNKLAPDKRERLLVLWFFEEKLKASYGSFIRALNDAAHDTVDANKEKALLAMHKLLQGHPEQESVLLASIVNKMGDPSHKIGSKVVYTLTKLLDVHPAMKQVVMEEVEKLIFRSNMSKRAQYYGVCFLTQLAFTSDDSVLASRLIAIYFSLFKACTKTGDIDSKMMSALLNGVSRAFPFMKGESAALNEHVNTVYKVVHLSRANVSIHALSLLYLVVGDTLTDRFMSVLYKKIGEPSMFRAAHHAIFLSVIFKSLNRDENKDRLSAFIKRLLQVSLNLPVPLVCGILMLLSQIKENRKDLFPLALEQEASIVAKSLPEDDEEERYEDFAVIPSDSHRKTVEEKPVVVKQEEKPAPSSWFHAGLKTGQNSETVTGYDPYQRLPQHAHASGVILAELFLLTRHFHPSVALFATNIIEGKKIVYNGDPLQDFSLIRFLDRFVFKNPKKVKLEEEQVSTFARFGRKKYYSSVGLKGIRLNTDDYLNNDEKTIPVDEYFMYRYLKDKKLSDSNVKKEKDEDDDSEAESLGDDEFDAILNRVSEGKKSRDDDDIDFMNEIGSLSTEKKRKQQGENENEDDEGEEDMDDDDGSDVSEGEGEEELDDDDDSGGSNAEDFDGDEEDDLSDGADLLSDDDEDAMPKQKSNKVKRGSKGKGSGSLFASAEEFAELLERDDYLAGSSAALSNKDNAGVKQLMWEDKRDQWVKGDKFRKSNKSKDFKGVKRKYLSSKNKQSNKKRKF